MNIDYKGYNRQKGSTLIITIILLMVLTVLAISQISFNSILTRIATNATDALIAFQTAEGALFQASNRILAGDFTNTNFIANTNGLYLTNSNNAPIWTTVNWASSAGAISSYQGNSSTSAAYIIEQLPFAVMPGQSMSQPTSVYRITARAVGSSGGSPVLLQAVIQVPQY